MTNHEPTEPRTTPEASDPGLTRWTRLLNKVDKDPDSALDDPRCLTPHFLERYFDLCDGKALEAPWVARDYAEVAFELAKKTGDRHLLNRAAGVYVHALIGSSQWQEARRSLDAYYQHALECCPACAADWLRRLGDLAVETSDPRAADTLLELSAGVLGTELDDDARGRILFLRGIAHHFQGNCGAAVEAAGDALALLSESTPRGYFLDSIAFLACFLEHDDDPGHDRAALEHLASFRRRIKGLRNWHEVRDRMRWVEGQLHARLDHPRRARARLEAARKGHVKRSPHHWALAVGIDEALIYGRHKRPELYDHAIHRIVTACADSLKLDAELSGRLARLRELLKETPWQARLYLSQFRRSFKTPVPGLLVDLWAHGVQERRWAHGDAARDEKLKIWYR